MGKLTPENRSDLENKVQIAMFILLLDAEKVRSMSEFIVRQAPLVRGILSGEIFVDDRSWEELRNETSILTKNL